MENIYDYKNNINVITTPKRRQGYHNERGGLRGIIEPLI